MPIKGNDKDKGPYHHTYYHNNSIDSTLQFLVQLFNECSILTACNYLGYETSLSKCTPKITLMLLYGVETKRIQLIMIKFYYSYFNDLFHDC